MLEQLEQENADLKAEIADLRQQRDAIALQASAAQSRVIKLSSELSALNDRLQSEVRLHQDRGATLSESESIESESLFSRSFEQAGVGIVINDLDGRWLWVNQRVCDMLGYSKAELLALTLLDVTHPDDIPATLAVMPSLMSGEQPFCQFEKRYLRKDGSLFWVDLTISRIRSAAGDPIYFVTTIQDITLRKDAERVSQGQQWVLQSTLAELANEPKFDNFLGQVLDIIVEHLQASVVDVWLHDVEQATTNLYLTKWNAQLTPDSSRVRGLISIPLSAFREYGSAWHQIVIQKQPFVYQDLQNHDDFDLFEGWSAMPEGANTMLLVPLVSGDKLFGVFSVSYLQGQVYSPESLPLVTALAQQVALAIQLTRLADEAKQGALMEEHNRLAREIHDTLAQTFSGILLQLSNAQYYAEQDAAIAWNIVEQVRELARTGLAEARRSVWSLHPDAAAYCDLSGSLKRSLAQLTDHTDLKAKLIVVGTSQSVPPDIGMNLLRIGQEATTNALRHAEANTLKLELAFNADDVSLCIQDDGKGFNFQMESDRGGFGLQGMQQRCDRLGGQLTLCSQPGQGTYILVQVPFTPS